MHTGFLLGLEALLLVTALSVDAFVASFAYGSNKIKIPLVSMVIISAICSLTLAFSLLVGSLVRPLVPPGLTKMVCFTILLVLGVIKLFDSSIKAGIRRGRELHKKITLSLFHLRFILTIYADPQAADQDHSRVLSPAEASALAAALSLDGLAVGFGAALVQLNCTLVVVLSFLMGLLAVLAGCGIGRKIAETFALDLSWLSGLLLMVLAFLKL